MTFWQWFWLTVQVFLFFSYLVVLIQIVTDLFRDKALSGLAKAVWVFFLVVVPLLTALVYLITRGTGMTQRQLQAQQEARATTEDYIRSVTGTQAAGPSPAEQIATAKSLLDAGAIDAGEFARLKSAALAGVGPA